MILSINSTSSTDIGFRIELKTKKSSINKYGITSFTALLGAFTKIPWASPKRSTDIKRIKGINNEIFLGNFKPSEIINRKEKKDIKNLNIWSGRTLSAGDVKALSIGSPAYSTKINRESIKISTLGL